MDYYSAIKGNKVVIYVQMWMDLRNVGLKKPDMKGHILHDFVYMERQIHKDRTQIDSVQDIGALGDGKNCLTGMGFPFRIIKIFQN